MKQPLGITFTPKPGQPLTGIYEADGGAEVFETDAPYLLSDGRTLMPPLPVFDAGGPTFTDAIGNVQSAMAVSGLTPSGPVNDVPPSISGDEQVREELTVDPGEWSGEGTVSFAYLWFIGATPTSNTSTTFTPDDDAYSQIVRVRVTATDDNGSTVRWAQTGPLAGIAPTLSSLSISGAAEVGETLTASLSADGVPSPSVTIQWLRDGDPISGAVEDTYDLVEDDAGALISFGATATNTLGSVSDVSDDVGPVEGDGPQPVEMEVYTSEGDSIVAAAGSYPRLWAANNPDVTYFNSAVGGSGIAGCLSRLPSVMSEGTTHLSLSIGANDLMEYDSAEDFCAAVFGYFASARTYRSDVVRIAVGILPIDESAAANSPPAKAGFNNRRREVAAIFRAAVGNEIDVYIPLGEHPTFIDEAAAEGGPFSTDGLHWNKGGAYGIMLETFAAAMDPLKALSDATTPDQFTFTDQTNCEPNSTQTGRVVITGLRPGLSVDGEYSGSGTFARNQGAFGTGSVSFMNGDFAVAQLTASPTPEATVSGTLTVGETSDTFTATTAAAEPADFLATADAQFFDGSFNSGSTRTFEDVPHPGGVPFIAAFTDGGRTFTSITINGVALTALPGMDNGSDRFFIGATDLAAGSYDIVVTLSASIGSLSLYEGGITGIGSASPGDISKLASQYRFDGPQNGGSTVTLGSGGIGVLFGRKDAAGVVTSIGPSGSMVKDFGTRFFGKFTSSGTPTFTVTGSPDGAGTTSLTAVGFV